MEHNLKQRFLGVPLHTSCDPSEFGHKTLDDLHRKREPRRDDEIRWAVLNALHWDLAVPHNCIGVTVTSGWVTLTGQVRRAYEKSCCEADVLMTEGVLGLTNKIEFKPD